MNTQMKTQTRKSRFSHLALALALSTGTVGGMMSFAAMTEPAFARGNGGGGAGPAGGGEGGNVMSPAAANIAGAPNRGPRNPPQIGRRGIPDNCNGSRETINTNKCKYTQPRAIRVVNIHGFANCAVVQQTPFGEFYCVRPM